MFALVVELAGNGVQFVIATNQILRIANANKLLGKREEGRKVQNPGKEPNWTM